MLGMMATCNHLQSDIVTLRIFGGQNNSVMDVMQSATSDSSEVVSLDYLQDCVNSHGDNDLAMYQSSKSAERSHSDLHLSRLNDCCRTTKLNDIDMNIIKIKYVSLDIASQSTNKINNDSNREGEIKGIDLSEFLHSSKTALSELIQISKPLINSTNIDSNYINKNNEFKYYKNDGVAGNTNSKQNYFNGPNLETLTLSRFKSNLCLTNRNTERSNKKLVFATKNIETKADMVVLDKHIKACEQCNMTFKYKRHLDRHLEGHQKNNCPHCNEKFARRKHLEVHLFRVHGERSTKHPHVCDICSRGFPKNTLLEWHKAKHLLKNKTYCDCGALIEPELYGKDQTDKQIKKNNWLCSKCVEKSCIQKTSFYTDQIQDENKCLKCEITLASKKNTSKHFKIKHSTSKETTEGTDNGVYFCTDCTHKFQKEDDYIHHAQSASHLNKLSKDILVRGIFTCNVCSKELISQRALDQHVRRIHKGEKRFLCDIYGCKFQCARKTDLDRHRHLHVEERNVICEHCGKTFTSVSILNDHVLYVHNKERQFICEECGKAFKRNSLLKRHKLSHQQVRPFACMQCNTAFKRSHHLTRHMESCHRIILEKKKKVVKLMRTEGGHLVPIPEAPKKLRYKKVKIKDAHSATKGSEKCLTARSSTTNAIVNASSDAQVQLLPNYGKSSDDLNSTADRFNFLTNTQNNAPQILSLVDMSSGQVLTVKVGGQEILPVNNLVDQLYANCNDTLDVPNYQDLEFQNTILSVDQNYYDQTNFFEMPMENGDGSLLSDTYGGKIDSLSTMENYFTQPFPTFLNF